jgi:hypothetical protein
MGNGGVGPADNNTFNFVDSLVCDDSIAVTDPQTGKTDNVHSQVVLHTSGRSFFHACIPDKPQAGVYGTFTEKATPAPGWGRGIFQGVTVGEIIIEGTINCQFAMDMKFRGEVCLRASEKGEDRD